MSERIIERKRRVDASLAGSFLVRRRTRSGFGSGKELTGWRWEQNRIQVNLEKKEKARHQIREEVEHDMTFKPAINKSSRSLKSRSFRVCSRPAFCGRVCPGLAGAPQVLVDH